MYILQSATNRNEGGKINGYFMRRSIPAKTRVRRRGRGEDRYSSKGERERAKDVFPLFLLSTLVVDSTTIRGTSGKHRVPFNWANFLLSEEKLHSYLFIRSVLPRSYT